MPFITVVIEYHADDANEEEGLRSEIHLDIEDIVQRYDNVNVDVHDQNMLAYDSGALGGKS